MLVDLTPDEFQTLTTLRDFHYDDDPESPGGEAHQVLSGIILRMESGEDDRAFTRFTQDVYDALGVLVELGNHFVYRDSESDPYLEPPAPRTREVRWALKPIRDLMLAAGQFQNAGSGN